MKYLFIALFALSATGYAQTTQTSEGEPKKAAESKGLLAWREGAPDLDKPSRKAPLEDRVNHSTISIKSLREDLKGIGVYAFTNANSSRLAVQLNNYANENILVQIVDKTGRVMHSQFILVDSDDEDYTLDISSFTGTSYMLVLSNVKEKRMSVYALERDRKI